MFTLNQQVICIDDDNQPTLQEGKEYTVREVGERGIRVRSATGDIRYEFANSRFRVVEHWEAAPVVAVAAAMPLETRRAIEMAEHGLVDPEVAFRQLKWEGKTGCLIVEGKAYEVELGWNYDPGEWSLKAITSLRA